MPQLAQDSSLEAIQFAEQMIQDGLWTAGRSRTSKANFERACLITEQAEALRLMAIGTSANPGAIEGIDMTLSALAIEASEISKIAIADKSLKLAHFDPWVLTCVIDADAHQRKMITVILAT